MKLTIIAVALLSLAAPAFAQGAINANTYRDGKLLAETAPAEKQEACDDEKPDSCFDATSADRKIDKPGQLGAFPTAINNQITD